MKQVILVRSDLKLPKGKMAVQVAHASVSAYAKSTEENIKEWESLGQKKVVLKVADEKELVRYFQAARDNDLACSLITDAGRTVIAPGTKTCVGIGPDTEEKIDQLTSTLKMV